MVSHLIRWVVLVLIFVTPNASRADPPTIPVIGVPALHRLYSTGDAIINVHSVCRYVKNNGIMQVMIPFRNPAEWSIGTGSFLAYPHPGLQILNCSDPSDPPPGVRDPAPTFVTFVLDESASMKSTKTELVNAVNSAVVSLKASGEEIYLSMLLFNEDHLYVKLLANYVPYFGYARTLYNRVPIAQMPDVSLTEAQYIPAGNTPLYDAIREGQDHTNENLLWLAAQGRAGRAVIITFTDGKNNMNEGNLASAQSKLIAGRAAGNSALFIGLGSSAASGGYDIGFFDNEIADVPAAKLTFGLVQSAKNAANFAAGLIDSAQYNTMQDLIMDGGFPYP